MNVAPTGRRLAPCWLPWSVYSIASEHPVGRGRRQRPTQVRRRGPLRVSPTVLPTRLSDRAIAGHWRRMRA